MPASWGFLTNYALVLVYVVQQRDSTVREIAQRIGITERATLSILRALDDDGIVRRQRDGRRNTYSVDFDRLASSYRPGGVAPLTPRAFVNGIIRALLDISDYGDADLDRLPRQDSPDAVALAPRAGGWGFFTNHLLMLLAIARDASRTVHELATSIRITERAAVKIVNELEVEGIIFRRREGRRTRYTIDVSAFRTFPRWRSGEWSIPPQLINIAADLTEGLIAQQGAPAPATS